MTIKGKGFSPDGGGFASLIINDVEVSCEEIKLLRQQLAECQVREKVLRDAASEAEEELRWFLQEANSRGSEGPPRVWRLVNRMQALAMPSDSTALDTMLKQAKREALLEAASHIDRNLLHNHGCAAELRRRAKELE